MRFTFLLALLLASSAQAESYTYGIFFESDGRFQDVEVTMEFDGQFAPESSLTAFRVFDVQGGSSLPLFVLTPTEIQNHIILNWLDEKTLHVAGRYKTYFSSVVEKEYLTHWMDASIAPGDRHMFASDFFENGKIVDGFRMSIDGTIPGDRFDIGSKDWAESCLFGVLKRVR